MTTKSPSTPKARPSAHTHEKDLTVVLDNHSRVRWALKLSDAAAKSDMNALRKEVRTRKGAASFLREAGILTPTGRLSRRFGG